MQTGALEVRQAVGERVKLKPHGVCRKAHAGGPCPLQRVLTFLGPLLCGAAGNLDRSLPKAAAGGDDVKPSGFLIAC